MDVHITLLHLAAVSATPIIWDEQSPAPWSNIILQPALTTREVTTFLIPEDLQCVKADLPG